MDYAFETDKGVSGILLPNGEFHKCGNAQHHYLIEDMALTLQFKCLYFSSPMIFGGDGLITTTPETISHKVFKATEKQLAWLAENFCYFDRGQKRRSAFDFGINGGD
jgi:hypothetical protein